MKQLLFLLGVTIILTSCGTIVKHNEAVTKLHPVEDLHDDIDQLYKQLQRLHPRLYQYTSKETLDFKFDSLKKAIDQPMTSRTFHKSLAQVTKYVGQGHMSVSAPSTRFNRKERKARRGAKFDINNLDFEYLDDRIIVRNARGKDSVLVNAELLEVNGQNAMDLHQQFKKTVASDGYNTTFHNRVVGYRFLSYYQQANGRFDSIALRFRNPDSTFLKTYKRVFKSTKNLLKKDSIAKTIPKDTLTKTEKKAKRKIDRLKRRQRSKDRKKYGYDFLNRTYIKNLSFIGEDSTVAFLEIKSFSKGSKYEDFYEEVFAKIDSAKSQYLIIDLRNNFGGRLKEITCLYSYLTDENFVMINPSEINSRSPFLKYMMSNARPTSTKILAGIFSPFIYGYDLFKTKKEKGQLYYRFKASREQEPKPNNFKGKIYVLINGNSFSASSVLSTKLHGNKQATFVGEETGGAYNGTVAGFYKIYELPNTKVKARIGLAHIDAPNKTKPDGYGVKPDVDILPTYQDRLNQLDLELEWVLEDIKKK
ncbi:S41 family peptidase [Winogradskyella sp.]|uniref:S41 family peptidase n=1 Tax=Winogradskyella sp. TaxID=1883156 RepID=UPI00262EE363|nr:S41 family peptidase [Winogradskyella sp.]